MMMRVRAFGLTSPVLALVAATILVGTERASAQEVLAADPADVESVDAILGAVYDVISGPAGASRDWDRMRSLFVADAKLIPSFVNAEGEIGYRFMSVSEWIDGAEGYFAENAFYEVEIYRLEERYGHIAHAFSTYESRREAEGEPFTRGINSFQLLFDGSRWWIVNIYWQGETDSEPIPERYLP